MREGAKVRHSMGREIQSDDWELKKTEGGAPGECSLPADAPRVDQIKFNYGNMNICLILTLYH